MLTPTQANQVAQWIVNAEARRDKQGRLKVYKLPAADGGGTFEVAGINDRYHPDVAYRMARLIKEGAALTAEREAAEYIQSYTDTVRKWGVPNAVEGYLRDCAWNRGPKGALRILQRALNVADDGKFGPITKAAIKSFNDVTAKTFVLRLRQEREDYERDIAPPVGDRAKFWKGLLNRFDNATAMALSL